MKKKLLAAAIMAALTLSASAALAAPTFSGDAQLLTQKSNGGDTFTDVRLRLNIDSQLGDGIYAHGRIMGIDMSLNDYGSAGTGSSGAAVNMEQLYLGAKVGAVDVKVGRQPVGIGQGLLADINGIEGISLATAHDNASAFGFVGRSHEGTVARDTMAFDAGTKIEGVNVGVSYLKTNDTAENKYWGFNASTKIANNITLAGEYVKNDTANASGFLVKATVGEIAKKGDLNYAISYRNIEDKAVDGNWVTNSAYENSKGFRFAANYKVTDSATFSMYKDITQQQNDSSVKPNQIRAELNVNF